MEPIRFNSNCEKITQALNFFAIQSGGTINKLKALKLLFFADRFHLRKYGRLVSNDVYVAMDHGPVPSTAKDLAELNSDYGCDETAVQYSSRYIQPDARKYYLSSVDDLDESVFSDSDIEALDFAWKKFGHLKPFELRDLTHKYPEWAKQKDSLSEVVRKVQIDLLDFFDDPSGDVEKCFNLADQDRALKRNHVIQMAHLESLWS